MYTPGYEEENKTKPKLTIQIEEDDKGLTAEAAATGLLRGTCSYPRVSLPALRKSDHVDAQASRTDRRISLQT